MHFIRLHFRIQLISLVALTGTLLSFSAVAQSRQIKIACVGNSVTFGYTLNDPASQSYPALLQKKLGPGFLVGNFGHSGATLLRKGHRPYCETPEFRKALEMKADIVLIHLGLNDTDPRDFPSYRDDFIPDYRWLMDTFRQANPKAKIYICKMTPIFTGHPRFLSSTFDWYNDLQGRIEQVAAISKVPFIDLFAAFHDRPDLFTDAPTLHPNARGAARLAEVIYRFLTGDYGGLQLADIFTDNMVLQRGQPIRVWGKANAGTTVTIHFHGRQKKTTVAPDGKWAVSFSPLPASSQPQNLQVENEDHHRVLKNILIGDVWLCSGQSNMYFDVHQTKGGDSLLNAASAKQPVRLFKYKPLAETDNISWDSTVLKKADDLDFFSGRWQLTVAAALASFSAVGYVFGQRVQQKENIPIGLIELAVGGSPLISWLDRATLESHPAFEPALNDWRHSDYLMGWCRERADKNLANTKDPFQRHPYEPCFNFEAGIAKITGFPIKGVIWYQGESDADNAELYQKLFPLLVENWRDAWQEKFPFYFVQLSSLARPSWNYFRDAQRRLAASIPLSGMVVSSDLGDSLNVHYPDKIPVGLRLARMALHYSYGHTQMVPGGPCIDSVLRQGQQLILRFRDAKGLATSDGKPLRGFRVLDAAGNIKAVAATIKRDQVILQLPPGPPVKKVVYSWKPYSRANLVNEDRLPASTFMIQAP